ncbi:MAG: hypothetical protein JW880_06615, partial [Candidatus Thermoplasmatota archaeon]|nr:hypothetical protein [Candidatus Thermoplasmatota archaeon]
PLTSWQTIWYCLLCPPVLWWVSDVNPASSRLGAISRFFWFGYLGLPPRGLLGPWQFFVYLLIILGVPAAVVVFVLETPELEPALFLAALVFLWASILYLLYLPQQGTVATESTELP